MIYRTGGSPPATSAPIPTSIPVASPKPIAPSPTGPATAPSTAPPKVMVHPPAPVTPAAPAPAPVTNAANAPLTRAQVIETADELSRYTWVCKEANRHAACVRGVTYESDWQPNQQVAGMPYHWGGADGREQFERKLRAGLGAGSHKRHGVNGCTAGMDCSGFVAYCWGHKSGHDFSTSTFDGLATRLTGNVYRDLKPGDALNKPGTHIVLFAGYRPDGGPIVYEASGAAGRVIRNDRVTWSRLTGYVSVRSNRLVDP